MAYAMTPQERIAWQMRQQPAVVAPTPSKPKAGKKKKPELGYLDRLFTDDAAYQPSATYGQPANVADLVFQQTGVPDWSAITPKPQPYSAHPQLGGAPPNPLMQALGIQTRREDFGPPRLREDFGPPTSAFQREHPVAMGSTAAPRIVAPQPVTDAAPTPQVTPQVSPQVSGMAPAPAGVIPLGGAMPTPVPNPFNLTPEEQTRHNVRSAFRDTMSTGGPIFATMQALNAMNQAQPPTPRSVSGSSVIGLAPEQTTALLDRVQRQNEVEQQMYQHQQDALRAEADARAGRVFTAAEAEKNRQHADEIERKRIEKTLRLEQWKRQQPSIKPLTGAPGFAVQTAMDPTTGQMTTQVVKMPGAEQIPGKQTDPNAHGTWVDTYGPDGKTVVKRFITPSQGGDTQVAPPPAADPSNTSVINAMTERAKFWMGFGTKTADGSIVPMDPVVANSIAQAEIEDGRTADEIMKSLPDLVPMQKPHFANVKNADNSVTYKEVKEGDQVAPPTSAKPKKTPAEYLNNVLGTKWTEAGKQQQADLLSQAGYTPEEIAGTIGPPSQPGRLWGESTNYVLHPTQSTGTRDSSAGTNSPVVERTLKNGTKVKVRMTGDGQWEKVD